MKRWIVIRKFYYSGIKGSPSRTADAKKMLKKLKGKFPNIKFKINAAPSRIFGFYPSYKFVSLLGLLPTPHPNDVTRDVLIAADAI